jgi:hypothetical protein
MKKQAQSREFKFKVAIEAIRVIKTSSEYGIIARLI